LLKAGDKAPEFSLPDETGLEISLSALLSKGPLILYFYPNDFTPGCTKEACMVRDFYSEFEEVGITTVGISPNNGQSHQRFKRKYSLKHVLLADTKKHVIQLFGVDGPLGIGVRRATFLIDPNRKILDTLCADFRLSRHGDFFREAIARYINKNFSNHE